MTLEEREQQTFQRYQEHVKTCTSKSPCQPTAGVVCPTGRTLYFAWRQEADQLYTPAKTKRRRAS